MSISNSLIIGRKFASAGNVVQYSSPSTTITIIDKFTATNTGSSVATISVHLPAASESIQDSNKVTASRSIAPGETYNFPELIGQIMGPGGYIATNASIGNILVLSAAGRQILQ